MAVMSRGGIDTDVQNRMMRLRNDPNALGQQAQKTGDILDLIAARRAADLVAEQKKLAALQMNGSPATVKDQLEKELVDGQKEMMAPDLNKLREKTQGVSGVLQNQNRQRIAQQQRPTMRAAMGGIINAPAPNLNRMYNGGIVGYAEGGLTGDEIAAYLKRAGIKQEDFDAATLEERARVIEGINKLIAKDRDLGIARGTGSLNPFGGTSQSDAQMEDRNRQVTESIASRFRGDPTGEELMKGREEFNPTERQDAAERLMNLPDISEQDFSQQTMMPEGAMGITPGGDYSPTGKYGNTKGVDAQTGLTFAETQEALEDNVNLDTFSDELAGIGKTKAEAAALAAAEAARLEAEKPEPEPTPLEQLKQSTGKAFDPFANANAGIASVVDSKRPTPAVNPPGYKKGELSPEGQRMLEMQEAVQAAGVKDTPEGLTGSAAIQKKLDDMDGKKGIAGLVERFANTNFKKSYGDNFGALAQAGRDIVETGQKEKAQRRKFLEEQLGVQQAIEAADVAAGRDREKFDITEARLSSKMSIDDKNTVAELLLKANTAQNESLARLAKLDLDKVNSKATADYRMAALKLKEIENELREKGNTNAVQKVVQGYVNSATNFYKGLLANAMTPAAETAVKQELQSEISRIVGILGPDGALDLKALQKTSAGATATNTSGITVTPRAS